MKHTTFYRAFALFALIGILLGAILPSFAG